MSKQRSGRERTWERLGSLLALEPAGSEGLELGQPAPVGPLPVPEHGVVLGLSDKAPNCLPPRAALNHPGGAYRSPQVSLQEEKVGGKLVLTGCCLTACPGRPYQRMRPGLQGVPACCRKGSRF